MKLSKYDTLLFVGDSITDCGRARPIGEGGNGALGHGYVTQVDALIQAIYPELGIRVLNTGIGGDTVDHLKERWTSDVLDLKPDWLSILIGINDVWRQVGKPKDIDQDSKLQHYEQELSELVATTRPQVKGMVLMSPYIFESNVNDTMREGMIKYGKVVKKIAAQHDAIYVDLQAAFDAIAEHVYLPSLAFNWDRVHPDQPGHMTIAREFLRGIDFTWDRK